MGGREARAATLAAAILGGLVLQGCRDEDPGTERALVVVAEAMLEVDDSDLERRRPVLSTTWYPGSVALPDRVREAVVEATGLELWTPPSGTFRPADTLVAVLTFYPLREAGGDTLAIEADWFFPYDGRAWADAWIFRVACDGGRCRVTDRARAGHADYGWPGSARRSVRPPPPPPS